MTAQLSLDDMVRGESPRGRCRYLENSAFTGMKGDGFVVRGHCPMLGRTVYDRDCDTCTMWEAVQ